MVLRSAATLLGRGLLLSPPVVPSIFQVQPCLLESRVSLPRLSQTLSCSFSTSGMQTGRVFRLKASLWDSIRSGLLKNDPVVEPFSELPEEEEPEPEEIVLVEKEQVDGTIEKIVFGSGGQVDVHDLQILCDKGLYPGIAKHRSTIAIVKVLISDGRSLTSL